MKKSVIYEQKLEKGIIFARCFCAEKVAIFGLKSTLLFFIGQ